MTTVKRSRSQRSRIQWHLFGILCIVGFPTAFWVGLVAMIGSAMGRPASNALLVVVSVAIASIILVATRHLTVRWPTPVGVPRRHVERSGMRRMAPPDLARPTSVSFRGQFSA